MVIAIAIEDGHYSWSYWTSDTATQEALIF